MRLLHQVSIAVTLLLATVLAAQQPGPDPRMKMDLLLVVAHPDDDVLLGGFLARMALDEHKRVAVVYATNGDGGGNAVAAESGQALGKVREIEARRALHILGIDTVWFLGGHDTPGQDPLRSLDRWNHGEFLNNLVRLMRITRPDVVVTWLPAQVAGENHGDHQAASVLAVEAFDAAGNPDMFPEQLSMPREVNGMSNLLEGLQAWQPGKLYFFTDAFEVFNPYWSDPAARSPFRAALDHATGPVYRADETSPTQHVTYAELEARQQNEYATQEGAIGTKALQARDFSAFVQPEPLIFGKSLVGGGATDDVFAGVTPLAENLRPTPATPVAENPPLQIGDPWRFYARFWRLHGLEHLADLLPVPEIGASSGEQLHIPLLVCNSTAQPADFTIASKLPPGWTSQSTSPQVEIPPGQCTTVFENMRAPVLAQTKWQELEWDISETVRPAGRTRLRVLVGKGGGLPQ